MQETQKYKFLHWRKSFSSSFLGRSRVGPAPRLLRAEALVRVDAVNVVRVGVVRHAPRAAVAAHARVGLRLGQLVAPALRLDRREAAGSGLVLLVVVAVVDGLGLALGLALRLAVVQGRAAGVGGVAFLLLGLAVAAPDGRAAVVAVFFLLLLLGLAAQLLEEGGGLGGVLAAGADGRAVLVEEEGEGNAGEGQEGGDRRGPVDSEVLVHVRREEREGGTEEGAKDCVSSQDGGSEDEVSVDQVVHDGEENQDHAEAERCAGCDTGKPVNARVISPSKPEQADRHRDGSHERRRQTGLWRSKSGRRVLHDLDVALVVPNGIDDGGQHAYGDAEESETTNTGRPTTTLLVDDGEGGEKHVERSVDDGHVDGEQKDNGFAEEEDPGPGESCLESLTDSDLALLGICPAQVNLSGDFR